MPTYPFLTMRLWEQHKDPAVLDKYLRLLKRRRGACDEVWFATDYGFPPVAIHQQAAAQMAVAAEKVRAAGFVTSLQISNTLGHGSYLKYLDFRGITWQRMTGPDGGVAPYSNCPRDPDFHDYLRETLCAYVAWKPASVWIDDDLRMQNHGPVEHGCFCQRCLVEFGSSIGRTWSREKLVTAINAGNNISLRRAWLKFSRQSLGRLTGVIARAVLATAPAARLGFQHCDTCGAGYNGPDWEHVFGELTRVSGRPVGSRPGGGFYTDHSPRGMLDKAIFTAQQNSRLPACADDCRAEVENLPGAVTGKSAQGTVLESTLALAYGCTGLTFTPLMFTHEETAWHDRVLAKIAAWRPFWLRYLAASWGTAPAGLEIALSRQHAERPLKSGEWAFAWGACHLWNIPQLTTLGLPLCWGDQQAVAVLLHPAASDGLSEKELRSLLGRGVLTDGETIRRLQDRGLGHLLPVEAQPASERDLVERFTDDPLNGASASRLVQLTGLSGGFQPCILTAKTATGRSLSRYEWTDGTVSGMSVSVATTAGGGRLAVFGNTFWEPVVITARRAQILAVADWISRGRLPAIVETPGQVMAVPRTDRHGRLRSVLLLNCSLDRTPALKLRLRRPAGHRYSWIRPERKELVPVSRSPVNSQVDAQVLIPPLDPWSLGVLSVEGRK